jgi:hypothetical protein
MSATLVAALLKKSVSKSWDDAKQEWRIVGMTPTGDSRCICGVSIREIYYIANANKVELEIGNECIKHFQRPELIIQRKAAKMEHTHAKCVRCHNVRPKANGVMYNNGLLCNRCNTTCREASPIGCSVCRDAKETQPATSEIIILGAHAKTGTGSKLLKALCTKHSARCVGCGNSFWHQDQAWRIKCTPCYIKAKRLESSDSDSDTEHPEHSCNTCKRVTARPRWQKQCYDCFSARS